MIVTYELPKNQPLTEKQLKEIEEAKKRPITFDEDCMEMTDERIKNIQYREK